MKLLKNKSLFVRGNGVCFNHRKVMMTKEQNLLKAAKLSIKLHIMVQDTSLTVASVGVGLVRQDSTEKTYADVNRILGASYPDALICALIRDAISEMNA
jgi:hypothetical protein